MASRSFARNSVDGGKIIYLVDIGKMSALKFNTFWFEPTPQGEIYVVNVVLVNQRSIMLIL